MFFPHGGVLTSKNLGLIIEASSSYVKLLFASNNYSLGAPRNCALSDCRRILRR
jgi:hypothetical protein